MDTILPEYKNNLNIKWFYIVFCIIMFSSILKFSFTPNGSLTFDSYSYLTHANSILNGSLFFSCDPLDNKVSFFSTWPIGYPLFISFISFIFNIKVFLASKIFNLVLLFTLGIFFYKYLNRNALLSYFFVSVVSLKYISLTLSEFSFIVLCFIFVFKILNTELNFIVLLSGILIFGTRYIGVFILLFTILIFIIYKDKFYFFYFIFFSLFISVYFLFVKYNVGYYSGANRVGTSSSRWDTLYEIIFSFFSLFSVFDYQNITGDVGGVLYFLGIFLFLPFVFSLFKINFISKFEKISILLILLGFSYLIFYTLIILLNDWRHHNEPIPNRFLLPGFLFLVVGFLNEINFTLFLKRIFVTGLVLSLLFNGFFKPYLDFKKYNGLTYFKNIRNIQLEEGVFINKEFHLKYLNSCVGRF